MDAGFPIDSDDRMVDRALITAGCARGPMMRHTKMLGDDRRSHDGWHQLRQHIWFASFNTRKVFAHQASLVFGLDHRSTGRCPHLWWRVNDRIVRTGLAAFIAAGTAGQEILFINRTGWPQDRNRAMPPSR